LYIAYGKRYDETSMIERSALMLAATELREPHIGPEDGRE
jgi:hypothetical protein